MSVGMLGTVLIADDVMWGGPDAKIMISLTLTWRMEGPLFLKILENKKYHPNSQDRKLKPNLSFVQKLLYIMLKAEH